jgi:hypothetical protein
LVTAVMNISGSFLSLCAGHVRLAESIRRFHGLPRFE